MANKNITHENYIDEDFVWSQLKTLESGNGVLMNYSSRFLNILQAILNAHFKEATIEITILDKKMMLKPKERLVRYED